MKIIDERIAYSLSLYNASVSDRYYIDAFNPSINTTKWMINAIQSRQFNNLLASTTCKHKAALLSQGNRNANPWLNAPMINGIGMIYSNPEFLILFKRKLRHELIINNDKCICCDESIDELIDESIGQGIIYKHDLVVHVSHPY